MGAWTYGAAYGDYGQEFPVAWVVSDSGRTLLVRECDWFDNQTDWYLFYTDADGTMFYPRLTTQQVAALLSGRQPTVRYLVFEGFDEFVPEDHGPWQPVNADPTADVFETFQVTGTADAAAWVEQRCKELGWT